jgi:hypothetical protein
MVAKIQISQAATELRLGTDLCTYVHIDIHHHSFPATFGAILETFIGPIPKDTQRFCDFFWQRKKSFQAPEKKFFFHLEVETVQQHRPLFKSW